MIIDFTQVESEDRQTGVTDMNEFFNHFARLVCILEATEIFAKVEEKDDY